MSLSDPTAWFAICALCMLLCAALAQTSGFYRAQLAAAASSRFECIDGLRGFLALGVFGVHAVNMYTLHAHGRWSADSPFYADASGAGVGLFFMITGFLFWLRVLRSERTFDARAFFLSRLRRLVPMYAMSVLIVLGVVVAASGFALHESPATLARQLRAWLSFGFMHAGALNGVAEAHYINAVYWTLAYEWVFYLALPLLALFARGWSMAVLAAAVVVFGMQAPIVLNFLFGALAALIIHRRMFEGRLAAPWLGAVALVPLGGYFALPGLYGLPHAVALFGFFIFVVHGNSLFGLLRSQPAKVFGAISYSFYLTHCIALFVTVRAVDALVPVETLDIRQYWLVAALAAAGCVLLSALTYRYVEYPFLHSLPVRQPSRAHSEAVS